MWVSGSEILHRGQTENVQDVQEVVVLLCFFVLQKEKKPTISDAMVEGTRLSAVEWDKAEKKKQTAENAPGRHPIDHFTKMNAPSEGA